MLATELKNNANKIAKWTAAALVRCAGPAVAVLQGSGCLHARMHGLRACTAACSAACYAQMHCTPPAACDDTKNKHMVEPGLRARHENSLRTVVEAPAAALHLFGTAVNGMRSAAPGPLQAGLQAAS